ncbi:MAG: hypothetical protein ACXWVU_01405 [Sulfuricurvum sp.]
MAEEGNLFSYQIGYSSNDISTIEPSNRGGFYNGIDMMKTLLSGFGFGAGFDLNVWDAPFQNGTDNTMYSMGGTARLGYTFQNSYNFPLKLKAGIGYGIIKSVEDSGWGMQYEVGGEYFLYKSLGIGVKYKYAQADLLGTTFKNDSTVFMMVFGY